MPTTVSPPLFDFMSLPAPERRGGHTLEDRLERTWEALHADGATACLVCRSRMERAGGEGRCASCGSTLA